MGAAGLAGGPHQIERRQMPARGDGGECLGRGAARQGLPVLPGRLGQGRVDVEQVMRGAAQHGDRAGRILGEAADGVDVGYRSSAFVGHGRSLAAGLVRHIF